MANSNSYLLCNTPPKGCTKPSTELSRKTTRAIPLLCSSIPTRHKLYTNSTSHWLGFMHSSQVSGLISSTDLVVERLLHCFSPVEIVNSLRKKQKKKGMVAAREQDFWLKHQQLVNTNLAEIHCTEQPSALLPVGLYFPQVSELISLFLFSLSWQCC